MNERTRTALLAGLLLVVGLFVLLDLRGAGASDAEGPAPDHTQQARDLQDRLVLVEQETDWTRARDERAAQWDEVRESAIVAATPELAAADFRALLIDEARALGLSVDATARSTSRALEGVPSTLDRVHELEVRLTVSSHDPRTLHRFIDVIEHVPALRTHVAELTLRGPGVAQQPENVSATLTVRALGITPAPAGQAGQGGDA